MIISENGLVKAMKESYKTDGYTVTNISGAVAIWTDHWCIKCIQRNLPRKALAQIVEHAGELPEPDTAMYLRKGDDPQWASKDYVTAELAEWWTPAGNQSRAYMVPIVFAGLVMYQATTLECFAADPVHLDILERGVAEQLAVQVDTHGQAVLTEDDCQVCIQMDKPAELYGKTWMANAWAELEKVRLYARDE